MLFGNLADSTVFRKWFGYFTEWMSVNVHRLTFDYSSRYRVRVLQVVGFETPEFNLPVNVSLYLTDTDEHLHIDTYTHTHTHRDTETDTDTLSLSLSIIL